MFCRDSIVGVNPIRDKSIYWCICLAQLRSVLSGMVYGFPWVSFRLNLIFGFPLRFDLYGNETLAELCWCSYSCPLDRRIILTRPLCCGIPILSLPGYLYLPQLLRLSHCWMPRVFWYSWMLPHVFSWTRKWAFRVSELASSLSLWFFSLATMCLSSIDYSDYLLGCFLFASIF